jgi:hypothetical protein
MLIPTTILLLVFNVLAAPPFALLFIPPLALADPTPTAISQ